LKRTTPRFLNLSATLLVVALLTLAPSGHTGRISTDTPSLQSTPAPGEASLRATISPETGKVEVSTIPSRIQSTLTLDPETAEALRRDTQGLKEVQHANGAVSVNLQGRFQDALVARIDKNGKVVICTESGEDARAILQGQAVAAPPPAPEVQ
jgi:hypothetical protein